MGIILLFIEDFGGGGGELFELMFFKFVVWVGFVDVSFWYWFVDFKFDM